MKRSIWTFLFGLSLIIILCTPVLAQTGSEGQAYVVQNSDTLWKLAQKYLGDGHLYPAIVSATNNKAAQDTTFSRIDNINIIETGQKLWIPVVTTATTSTAASSLPAPAPTTVTAGGHIAFSFWNAQTERCTYEINIISVADCLAGSQACQATRRIFSLNNTSEPALSADGTRLAFRSWGQPESTDSPYINCAPAHPYRHLGTATLDGTGFISTGQYWEDSHPDWSPDGSRLIFDSDRDEHQVYGIYAISADGTNEQNMMLAGQQPSWAPDNNRFVYRGCDLSGNRCGLWTALAFEPKSWDKGVNLLAPVVQAEQAAHPDWSPTRDEIIYQRYEAGVWRLWLVNADGSNDHPLATGTTMQGLPAWSPDGNRIAYLTHTGQNWQIRLVNRDGSGDVALFTYDGGVYTVPFPVEPYGQRDWIDEQLSWSK